MLIPFFLRPEAPVETALALSFYFGLASGRLWTCRACDRPFIRPLDGASHQRCDECRQAKISKTGVGLPQSVAVFYERLRKVLNLRAIRERQRARTLGDSARELGKRLRMIDAVRAQRVQHALSDARLVQTGRMTLGEWLSRHFDVREKSRRTKVASEVEGDKGRRKA
jgi:hypothetical protein